MTGSENATTVPTKQRILDAAERLFAATGFRATSLRELTTAAEVNLAAVHYHFGSKEGLIRAVFARRLEPINAARIEALDALENAGGVPRLEAVLEAFLAPSFRLLDDEDSRAFPRLLGRLQSDPDREMCRELLFEQFEELRDRFVPAFCRALPEQDEATVMWRLHFMVGAMSHTLTAYDDVEWTSSGRVAMQDAEQPLRQLVAFAAAGMRAGAR
jgi:AcrR family transcriptional regulator